MTIEARTLKLAAVWLLLIAGALVLAAGLWQGVARAILLVLGIPIPGCTGGGSV